MFNRDSLPEGSAADLTTTARIRDAAIEVFGEHGFQIGVRAIAKAAGVSPGLVNHHFGSKDGLRAVCDAHVLQLISSEKEKAITSPDMAKGMLAAMADIEEYGPLIAYMVRSLQAGGPTADQFFDHLAEDAERWLELGVEAGTIKPSRDPAARARYLMMLNVGATVLFITQRQQRGEKIHYGKAIRELTELLGPPALEFYTQGLLTDPTILDTYLKET